MLSEVIVRSGIGSDLAPIESRALLNDAPIRLLRVSRYGSENSDGNSYQPCGARRPDERDLFECFSPVLKETDELA